MVKKISILVLFIGLIITSIAETTSVTLAWDASLDSGVTTYYVYYGFPSGDYTNRVEVKNKLYTTITNIIVGGTYYFAATASAGGLESDFSNEVSISPTNLPSQVINFEVISVQ